MKSTLAGYARTASAFSIFVGLAVVTSRPAEVAATGPVAITAPAPNAVFAAGPDYATDVLGDPWDMRNQEDIALDPAQKTGWSNALTPANGLLTGVTDGTSGANVSLLQRAWYMVNNPGRTGKRYPIDSTKYTKLAWKMSSTAAEFPRIFYFQKDIGEPNDVAGTRIYTGANNVPTPAGTNIYLFDMTQRIAQGDTGPLWASAPVTAARLFRSSTPPARRSPSRRVRRDKPTTSIMESCRRALTR